MNYVRLTILVIGVAILSGCASGFDPKPIESVPFRERTVTQTEAGLRVSTAVPSARETKELFGVALYKKGVQPVWIEIENGSSEEVTFLPFAVDTDYHSPIEVAALNRSKKARGLAAQYFFQNGVDLRIAPDEVRSGFVFTNLDEGTKAFNVDRLGWDVLDLFGVDHRAPLARYDAMGLVPLLHGRRVVELHADKAVIEDHQGQRTSFARQPAPAGRVAVWELDQSRGHAAGL